MTGFPFPEFNATLNGSSAVLLAGAYIFIKKGMIRAHATAIIAAVATSAVFLTSYLTYHFLYGMHRFPKSALKKWYLLLLGSHTILAVVIVPLIIITLLFAIRRKWSSHRKIAPITFWLWMYVSLTGVAVYWMLYQVAPKLSAH